MAAFSSFIIHKVHTGNSLKYILVENNIINNIFAYYYDIFLSNFEDMLSKVLKAYSNNSVHYIHTTICFKVVDLNTCISLYYFLNNNISTLLFSSHCLSSICFFILLL